MSNLMPTLARARKLYNYEPVTIVTVRAAKRQLHAGCTI
jgi:hypothetical protein